MRGARTALVIAVFAWMAPPAVASGPTSGVHVDPGSPAGKQYVLPIASARGETSGEHNVPSSPPLFGAGVTPAASTASSSNRGAKSGARQDSRTRRTVPAASASTRTARSKRAASPSGSRTIAASAQADGNSWLPLLGGGAMVLLIGGGSGLALRRRL